MQIMTDEHTEKDQYTDRPTHRQRGRKAEEFNALQRIINLFWGNWRVSDYSKPSQETTTSMDVKVACFVALFMGRPYTLQVTRNRQLPSASKKDFTSTATMTIVFLGHSVCQGNVITHLLHLLSSSGGYEDRPLPTFLKMPGLVRFFLWPELGRDWTTYRF